MVFQEFNPNLRRFLDVLMPTLESGGKISSVMQHSQHINCLSNKSYLDYEFVTGGDEYKSTCVQNFKQNYSVKVDEFEILSGVTICCKICDFLLNF